jgi:SHS2 domain-containing protein
VSTERFEILPHTADKEIKAFGHDLNELFENAAYGMFSLMVDLTKYQPVESREVVVEGADLESLLHNWLSELLYTFEVDRLLFVQFEAHLVEGRLTGIAGAVPFNQEMEWLGSAVKAVTYHGLEVRRTDERWECNIILDV